MNNLVLRLILILLIVVFILAAIYQESSGVHQLMYTLNCPAEYERDFDEIIDASGTYHQVCADFEEVRTETDVDTLIALEEDDARWSSFVSSDIITSTSFGVDYDYILAMSGQFIELDGLPVYTQNGIMVYHHNEVGYWEYRWYTEDPKAQCLMDYDSYIQLGTFDFPMCGGVLSTIQDGSTYKVRIANAYIWEVFDQVYTALFRYSYINGQRVMSVFNHRETLYDISGVNLNQYMVNNGTYLYYEKSPGIYNVMWLEGDAPIFKMILPMMIYEIEPEEE